MSIKRQTLWSLAPLVVITAINLASVPLFYRYLGAEMYALWFYVQTFSGAFRFMDLGLGAAVGRYIGVALGKGDHFAVRQYWAMANAVAIPLLLLMSAIFAVIGVIFGPQWFNVSSQHIHLLQICFLLGAIALFLGYYSLFWNVLAQAHLDFTFLSIVRMVFSVVQIGPAIMLAAFTRSPAVLISWGLVCAATQILIFFLHARNKYGLGYTFHEASFARLYEMSAYTGKTFAGLLINALLGPIFPISAKTTEKAKIAIFFQSRSWVR